MSAPLTWDEVKQGVDPADFNLLTIEKRLAAHGDLIANREAIAGCGAAIYPIMKRLRRQGRAAFLNTTIATVTPVQEQASAQPAFLNYPSVRPAGDRGITEANRIN